MLRKLKNDYYKLLSYSAISRYFKPEIFNNENKIMLNLILKIFNFFTTKKKNPVFDENRKTITSKNNFFFFKRKKKLVAIDHRRNIVLHSFFSPFKKKLYDDARNSFEGQIRSKNILFPRYMSEQNSGGILVVIEEKVPGVNLSECDQSVIDKFLDIYLDNFKKQVPIKNNSVNSQNIYNLLRTGLLRLNENLPKNSSFSKLYSICGEPFKTEKGYWPANYCHGQIFPINICYSKSDEDKYYVIDFEPGLIGIGPYAYDIAFFILYASDLISKNCIRRITKKIFIGKELNNWSQYFLTQIIWWSRNRKLNDSQINKIEDRSLKTLNLINETIGYKND